MRGRAKAADKSLPVSSGGSHLQKRFLNGFTRGVGVRKAGGLTVKRNRRRKYLRGRRQPVYTKLRHRANTRLLLDSDQRNSGMESQVQVDPQPLRELAHMAGRRYAVDHPCKAEDEEGIKRFMNELWCSFCFSPEGTGIPVKYEQEVAAAFLQGYRGNQQPDCMVFIPEIVCLPTHRSVTAIVMVMNEEEKLPEVISEIRRLPLTETIYVINGSIDGSFRRTRHLAPHSIIVHYADPLGHDVGRSVGAVLACSDILLVLDGDFPIPAEKLVPFVRAIDRGLDIALNDLSPFIGLFSERDNVTWVKEFMNRLLGRKELGANSLTAVPHALSRKAFELIGVDCLMIPPKAQVIALESGLKIGAAASVDVVTVNRKRIWNTGAANPVSSLIIGDHLEALKWLMDKQGQRLGFPDTLRTRINGRREKDG